MFVGLVLGFVAGLYVAWNFWPQPQAVETVVNKVHQKVSDAVKQIKKPKE